jgi:hypothetical protein
MCCHPVRLGESPRSLAGLDMISLAFITGNSSLEILLEGLLAHTHIDMN